MRICVAGFVRNRIKIASKFNHRASGFLRNQLLLDRKLEAYAT